MVNKINKKLLISIVCFLVLTIFMFISYNVFKHLNNQLINIDIPIDGLLLGEYDELISKRSLYYDLGMASKYIGFGSFGVAVILSCIMVYKNFKINKITKD